MSRISKLGIYDQHRCGPEQTTRSMDALHPRASKVRAMALKSSIKASGQERRFFLHYLALPVDAQKKSYHLAQAESIQHGRCKKI